MPCSGTRFPSLTPPRRGTDRTRTNACSPPGRGRGWVGSWKASKCRALTQHSHPVPLFCSTEPFAQLVELLPERARQPGSKLREVRRDVVGFFLPTRGIHGKKLADVLGRKVESREIECVRRR